MLLGWFGWLYYQINAVAVQDEARRSDAIAVFGAAEYAGRPSPVLHARLDHAVELYREQIAPLVITLGGGSDRDSGLTEGGVGRDSLPGGERRVNAAARLFAEPQLVGCLAIPLAAAGQLDELLPRRRIPARGHRALGLDALLAELPRVLGREPVRAQARLVTSGSVA